MNPISDKVQTGTLGELLVQIRLLQYGVQAAPPIKDSGNDLIAVKGRNFRAVSVRTTTTGNVVKPRPDRIYDVLAVVELSGEDLEVYLDRCQIYLVPQADVANMPTTCNRLHDYLLSQRRVLELFGL